MAPFRAHEYLNIGNKPGRLILNGFDGVAKSGEMLLVLGRPGSGCSTFLKTVSGELHGLKVDPDSEFAYNGIVALRKTPRNLVLTVNKASPRRR
jgi:ABC-type multidrug transport system ATPase subunit